MTKILVTVPNMHWIHASVAQRLLMLQQDRRYRLSFQFPSNVPFENNLHHIIVSFLKGDCDYWLSIDSDNPPSDNPLDLVELDKDIIGLPTPIWHCTGNGERPVYLNAYKLAEDGAYNEYQPQKGLQEVDAVGTGCFLMARRVFEHPSLQKGCFTRTLYPDGRVEFGNDLSFCKRAKKAGFKVWAHFDYMCDHFNELSLSEMHRAYSGIVDV